MLTRWDKTVIAFILLLAVVSYVIFSYAVFGGQGEGVEIFVDGKEYGTYLFSDIDEKKILRIDTESGYNVVEISKDGARMIETSCPDKVDIQSGKITKPGQMIICVPNKVFVRIISKGKLNVDKVTY